MENIGLEFGAISRRACHICVDMQRMFAEATDWTTPWFKRVLPQAVALVERRPERTVFTRFVPARRPGAGVGTWARYYERWASMTLEQIDAEMIELVPELSRHAKIGKVIDKRVYSPWLDPALA